MLASILLNLPAAAAAVVPPIEQEDTNYPWPGKFLKNQLIQEDRELMELLSIVMASGIMEE